MVTILDYVKRTNKEGKEFHALIVQGGLEMVKSHETGRYYATAKKASISSTFEEAMCQSLIGQQIPGSVQKIETEPYVFTVPETGEMLTLNHRWLYVKEGETITEKVIADSEVALPL